MIAVRISSWIDEYLSETEGCSADNDQRGFSKHPKTAVRLEGKHERDEQCIKDEDGRQDENS